MQHSNGGRRMPREGDRDAHAMKRTKQNLLLLTVVIAVTLAVLFAEIVYVLWRRCQTFRRRGESDSFLYFRCCWNKRSRVEPREACMRSWPCSPPEMEEQEPERVMKWQYLYGTSRFLFTIKEEEREGLDLDSEVCSSAESVVKTKRACFGEPASVTGTVKPEMAVRIEFNEATPFSTPCDSPPYYTPSSSPRNEGVPNADTGVASAEAEV